MIRAANQLPLELRISVGILLIYVFGVFLEILGRLFRVILLTTIFAGGTFITVVLMKASGLIGFAVTLIVIYILIGVTGAIWRHWRVIGASFTDSLSDSFQDFTERVWAQLRLVVENLRTIFGPDLMGFYALVDEHLEWYFGEHEELLERTLADLGPDGIATAAQAVGITRSRMHELADPEQKKRIAATSRESLLRFLIRSDKSIAELARLVLREDLRENAAARRDFTIAVFNYNEFVRRFRNKLRQTDVALKAETPEVYPEWDRLMAEGEFRRGVSIPIIGVLVSLGFTIIRVVEVRPVSAAIWVVASVSIVIGYVLNRAGTQKVKDANRVLYDCIRQDRIKITRDKIFGGELFVPRSTEPVGYISPLKKSRREWLEAAVARMLSSHAARMREATKRGLLRTGKRAADQPHCITCKCHGEVLPTPTAGLAN
jgi:hypothetical protein